MKGKKCKGKIVSIHPINAYGGVELQLYSFITSAVDGGKWSVRNLGRFTPGKEPLVSIE
jgi:hypothetical protein